MKKANYGTIVMVIGLMMCIGCSQVSFNNPFGEAQPNAAGVADSDESSDKVDPQSAGKMPEHKICYLNVKNADNSANPTSFKESETVMLTKVSISGCTFDGWYEVTDNIADTSTDGWAAGAKTDDVTLWAKWSAVNNDPTDPVMPAAKVYTIRFGKNGGSGTLSDITADVGQITVLPACTIVPPVGKKFGSWNGKADGSDGISYADGASVKNLADTDGEVVTLYAQWIDKEAHRIIYQNIKNADNSSNPTYFMESESVALADVTTDGYTFDGWYDSSSDFGDAHHVSSWAAGEQTSDVILYAKWTANEVTYTVKRYFQNVSGSGYEATADIVKSGLTDEVTDVTADEVIGFTPCTIVQQKISADGSTVVSVYYDRDVVVYTFNANGGKWNDESNVKKAVGLYGAEVETPINPARVGYTYAGWDKTLPTVFGETVETWTAQWTANTYTIVFNKNGGTSGTMSNLSMTYDTAKALTNNAFSKTGYTFLGWSDSLSATAAKYTNSQNVLNLTATSGETVTLYAIWKANTYNVVFNANDGSGVMANQTMTYDTTINLNSNAFYRTGYTFQGWATSASGTKVYDDAASVSNLSSTSGGTYNLYAKWTANTYTVKFNNNGGFGSMSNLSMTYGTEKALTANTFTRAGYTFLGWSKNSSAASAAYTDGQSVSDLSSNQGDTVTLYAVWKITAEAHVGDIMYSDMTFSSEYVEGKTPIGIVFEVGAKVKIVHLSQSPTALAWCLSSADGYKCNPPTSTSDGSGNWQIICDAVSDEGTAGNYSAFEYVIGLGSGWYMPAKDELNAVYTNITAINTGLTVLSNAGVSVTTLGTTSRYWSSSSRGNNFAWSQSFSVGSPGTSNKKLQNSVRAVRAF